MQIDWFTFFAQLVNFTLLLILLQRFLYRPIVAAMHAREADLAARFAEAADQQKVAQEEAEQFRRKRAKLDEQRQQLLVAAQQQAEEERRLLLQAARAEVADLSAGWRTAVEREKEIFLEELRQRVGDEVIAVSEKVLGDLADEALEQRMIDRFLARLPEQADHELQNMFASDAAVALSSDRAVNPPSIVVRTAHELQPGEQERIRRAIHAMVRDQMNGETPAFATEKALPICFETAPALICGVELQLRDAKLSWNVHAYLESMEQALAEQLAMQPIVQG